MRWTRTALEIDDELLAAVAQLARVEREHGRPVIRAPARAPPITTEIVRRALGED